MRLLLALALFAVALPGPVLAQDVAFGQPEAQAELGLPVTFSTSLQAPAEPQTVELLLRAPGERAVSVMPADVSGTGGNWQAEAVLEGEVVPNTPFSYRFRVRQPDGEVVLGPEAEVVVVDRRFTWRTIEGDIVRLHWYEGDEAFARRALEIGESSIRDAAELLGVVETEPVDFFIYSSEAALREALGRGTRENVGGQAHAHIRTLFGLIGPHEVNSEWVDVLVAHELTHLVFDTATDNPYNVPPRWLNEGVAVYLSEGYNRRWQSVLEQAVRQESVIPLDGLGGLFPTTREQFELAYAQSVAAVDYFIRTYDEPTLWSLVRSYSRGLSDDEAFREATGDDMTAFNAAWMESLGLDVPEPLGPRRGAAGPLPPGWDETSPSTPAPGEPTQPATPATSTTAPSPMSPPSDEPAGAGFGANLLAALLVVIGIAVVALLVRRRLLT